MPKKRENEKKPRVSVTLTLSQWLSHARPKSPSPSPSPSPRAADLFQKYPSNLPEFSDATTAVDLSPSLTDSPRWSIGARDRLFLPDPDTDVGSGSLIEAARLLGTASGERSARIRGLLVEMHSRDPIEDFKRSMAEMLRDCGVEKGEPLDWQLWEELLQAYLEVNEKAVYRYIFAAFFDLTVEMGQRP